VKDLADIVAPVLTKLPEHRVIEVSELQGSAKALFLASLGHETRRPVVLITATEEQAASILEDLRFFSATFFAGSSSAAPRAADPLVFALLPEWGMLPFEADSPDSATVGERMRFLYHLLSGAPGFYALPVAGLVQKLPPWHLFADTVRTIVVGKELDPDRLMTDLVALGYESASSVTRTGEFSRRGGIIDIHSPFHENPLRIEFFGNAVESLREFDAETQRSLAGIAEAVILPVRELIVTEQEVTRFKKTVAVGDEGDDAAEHAGLSRIISDIAQGLPSPGAEFLAPYFYEMDGLFRYLPEESLIALVEPDDIRQTADAFWEKVISGREEEGAQGRRLPQAEELYLDHDRIEAGLAAFPNVLISLLSSAPDSLRMDTRSAASLGVRITKSLTRERDDRERPAEGTIPGLSAKLRAWSATNRITLVCGTDEARDRLKKMFGEYGLVLTVSAPSPERTNGPWPVSVTTGRLSEGFSWPDVGLLYITEEEIFGRKIHHARGLKRTRVSPFLSTFKELKPGDYVVHRDYGVGEYQGLTHISVDGFETDYVTLRYEPEAKLHVPLYSLDKVQKYVGVEGTAPKVDRIGAPQWARTKEKVRKDILEMARDLVAIYAARESQERPAFTPPDNLYREFESSFPFEETLDQEKAIEDVVTDMQRQRPMDRLVCGDVGYGKTEVALRAAFKAVEDGHQVAMLVPTTILAAQHLRTFTRRLAPFSVTVDMLSRFRTKQEQKDVLRRLRDGTLDIVIGTHRLLQKDVAFRGLGLLVVDEEHRFGVKHKERIKELKKLVDVLTLTATPIPRTLHMSLSGLRDLSIIETPPLDRQSIQVVLARFGPRVIREAVARELERGGRVFFVHNRVQGIERMADFVKGLAPEAKIGIGHGQMHEDDIEEVMAKFIAGELNVLVTTTIIESGIDIPEANTIIINRADRFGLAELYQIKGRVGRSREKAYAYLLTPADEALSDIARKRLRAIQELSELGAGFRIAAQDLETRGAGNLLGRQQSGHIAAVGIDLYTEMMEEAVAELRGEEIEKGPDTQINLRASAFIPEDYIGDISLRLAAYKQISAAADEQEIDALSEEFRDRYGEPPEPLRNLLDIMTIRILCRGASVSRVDGGKNSVNITFAGDANIPPDKVMALLRKNKKRMKLIPEYTLQIILADDSLAAASEAVKKCLQELV
jgi:transcription-repair coupling factor (superfamily II helicase)